MDEQSSWCVIVNRLTCSSGEMQKWKKLLGDNQVAHNFHETFSLDEVDTILSEKLKRKHKHYLFAGGDGTLHQGGNLLIQHANGETHDLIIGVLPCGTGNDWVRSFGVSKKNLINSLQNKSSSPFNVLQLEFANGQKKFAFNMVGGALDAAVVDSLNATRISLPGALKYPFALLKTLTKPHRWNGRIAADGKIMEGDWLTIQAGFGKYCGGGMYVLPHATTDKAGLLIMKPKSIAKLITSLPKLYNGKIAKQKEAIAMQFSKLEITHTGKPIPIEADGEFLGYTPVTITSIPKMMKRLM